jgi:hypothetical protein
LNASPGRERSEWIDHRRADLSALVALAVLMLGALIYFYRGGAIGSIDSLVGLYPAFALLGDRITSGELPIWNSSLVAGSPLAGDLQSGWFYLPVMFGFTLLPLHLAAIFLSAVHLALAGFGTYGLARLLGMAPSGSTVAAVSYMFSGWYFYRMACCPADISTAAWLPVILLTTELALRADPGGYRTLWRLLSAFALAQVVSAWVGPGSYYVVLAYGGYLVYRTLIEPVRTIAVIQRLRALIVHGLVVGIVSVGLAAGGLLPRNEFYQHSGLGEGYPTGTPEGWTWFRISERLLGETTWNAGAVTLGLAMFGVLILRRRFLAPFWLALVLFAIVYATRMDGLVQEIAYTLLPGLESVQQNLPNRILTIAYLGIAMLAGGVASEIARWRPNRAEFAAFAALAGGIIAYAIWADGEASTISSTATWPLGITVVVLAAVILAPGRMRPALIRIVPIALLIAVTVDLVNDGYHEVERQLDAEILSRVDLETYYDPAPAAVWLQQQEGEPFRFAGIDPSLESRTTVGVLLYGRYHGDPMTAALVVNHRASLLGLEDIQASNFPPMRLLLYDDVIEALNGKPQDYHGAALLSWEALQSPLVDLLNVRYIVVPRLDSTGNPPPEAAFAGYGEVWADDEVRILENRNALPRAWFVTDVQPADSGSILAQLASGAIDPRSTALINGPVPDDLSATRGSAGEVISIDRDRPERLRVRTTSTDPALLVFSEMSYPSWRVTIDGERAELIEINQAFMGVIVPAGEHTVELVHSGRTELLGLGISGLTILVLAGYGIWFAVGRSKRTR